MTKISNHGRNVTKQTMMDDLGLQIQATTNIKTGCFVAVIAAVIITLICVILIHHTALRLAIGFIGLLSSIYLTITIAIINIKLTAMEKGKQNISVNNFSILEDKVIKVYHAKIQHGVIPETAAFVKTENRKTDTIIPDEMFNKIKPDDIIYLVRESGTGNILLVYPAKHTTLDAYLQNYILPYELMQSNKLPAYKQ